MNKTLIIVFVKNLKLGTVKTRLAKKIGNQGAYNIYKELIKITEKVTKQVHADKRIYFSETISNNRWQKYYKAVQKGNNLGDRMKNAFKEGFKDGYENIILIGSDLPDINYNHIEKGFQYLKTNNMVFGPALDGGYYLIGMSQLYNFVFDNKPWSESNLLEITLNELNQNNITYNLLETLNDIDTFEDLRSSSFYKSNIDLQEQIKQHNV